MQMKIMLLSLAVGTASLVQSAGGQTAPEIYKSKCAMCHGTDGSGNTPAGKAMKASNLRNDEFIKASDSDLALAITKGKGKMPAYGAQYSHEQIEGLVDHIRQLQKAPK